MRSNRLFAPVSVIAPTFGLSSLSFRKMARRLAATATVLAAGLFCTEVAKGQTLTVNGAAADLYSAGYVNLPNTQVGQSVTQNVVLKATGGTVTITSYSTPAPANLSNGNASRIKEFTVGALSGCATGTAIATNGTCTIPVKFTPAYVGYQTSPLTVVTNRGTFQFGLNGVGVGPQAVLMPGILSTIAGNGKVGSPATTYTGDSGQATAAEVSSHGFAFDALGNLFEAEFDALAIRKITAAGVISTVAGSSGQTPCATPTTAASCGNNGPATAATFNKNLPDVAFDSAGNYYIADLGDNKVRRVDAVTGVITTIAGTGTQSESGDGGAATSATLNTPEAVLVDYQDNIYILDSNASPPTGTQTPGATVRVINHTTGVINTVAGVAATPCAAGANNPCGDGGQATKANFGVSASFYLDPTTDNLWIADRDANRIRFVNDATAGNTNSLISTVAGTGATGYTGDGGKATQATFNGPHGIWVDPAGDLYISDRNNNVVRFVSSASGLVSTLAGGGGTCTPGGNGTCGDGGLANGPNANLTPDDVRLDVLGNLYIADQANYAIRKVTQNPITLTFPSVAIGVTSGPLSASLVNIGSSALTYTTPASGSNAAVTTTGPTAAASNAFAQTNTTTCGPIYSTSTSGNTLASGAVCNFVISFTPDTVVGNYTGTLIETDNSYNAGASGNTVYPTAATQLVNLAGSATQATATVGVTTTPNPSTYGQSVAIKATLSGAGVPPTGTVTFTYTPSGSTTAVTLGTGTISTTNGVTTATISTTALPVGSDSIVATYGGDSNYVAGTKSSAVIQTVNQAPVSSDTLTASPNPATTGGTVTLVFTVPDGPTAPTTATQVTFTYTAPGSTTPVTITSAVKGVTANGSTTYTTTTTSLPVGTDTITANFTGDTNYASGSLTTPETINPTGAAGQAVTVTTNPTIVASADTITYSIPVVAGAAVPTGSVSFTSGNTNLGSATFPASPTAVTCPSGTGTCYTVSISTTALPLTVSPATSTPVLGTFTAGTTSGYSSGTASTTVVVNQVSGSNDAVTAGMNTTTVGTADPLTFSIPVVTGAPVPAGMVTFTSGSTNLGSATWPATPTTGTCPSGSGTCYLLADSPSPTNIPLTTAPATNTPITATFKATSASGYASAAPTTSVVVNPASGSSDTLTVANNPITYGTADMLTFSIPATSGVPPPTGTVVFTAGSGATTTTLGSATWPANAVVAGGFYTISISPTSIPVGSPTSLTATFNPSASSGYGGSAPTATVTVTKVPVSSDSIVASPNPATFGATVTLTFSVPTVNNTPPAATTTVTFTNGTTVLGTANVTGVTVNGVTTYTTTTTTLPVGSDTITGTFTGDGNYASGVLTTTEVINPANSTSGLTATPNPTTFGTPVTLTETIAAVGGTCPSGPATFMNNGVSIGNAPVVLSGTSCTATLVTSTLPVGTDPITVTVPASGGFSAIASGPVNVVIGKNPGASDVLTTSPNPSLFGAPVVITETLVSVGGIAPTGTVTFYNNGTAIGSAPVVGLAATITTLTLPVGTDPITATYTGDANYATVNSGPVSQVVNQTGSSATLAAGPNPATFGTPVTLTETITPINGSCPAGPTTFYNNGVAIGTGVITLTNGSCVATLTSSTLPVGTDSITATVPASNGFAATTTGPVSLVINKANGADTLASSPNPSVFGTPVTITDTIPIEGGVAPTGTVTFYEFGNAIGTGTVNAQGVATFVTSTLPVGTDSLTATYAGDGNYTQVTTAPINQVVTAVSTTATLAAGPNPANFGTTVTITETIPVTNNTPATGTVTFLSNGTQIGTGTLVNGVATITSSTLPVGTDQITATYPGDGNYTKVSSGPVAETINKANGGDTLAVNPDPAQFGTTVTITDTIPTVGGVSPTGTVTFYNNGTAIGTGTVNSSGVATLTTTTLPVGTDPITATYDGDGNYAPVTTGPVNETITVGNTIPVLSATPNPATFGTTVTLTEAIPGINGIVPTGTVTFFDNGTQIGTGTVTVVNGVATLTTSTLPIGTDPITATYSGDSTYGKAQSGPLNVVITKAAPVDTLTGTPNPSVFGSPVTLTFTVPPVNGVAPTGTVSFYNGTTLLGTGTVNASGVATITTTQLPYGMDTVVAQYPGDNNYAPAAPTATIVVGPVVPVSVVTVPTGTPVCSSSVTLTDTITLVNGVALGGTVQFYDNGTPIGTPVPVPASGIVTLTTTALPCTANVITAIYTPPANSPYLTSTGGPTTINTPAPDFSIAATPPNQTVSPGDTTTYTVSLAGVGAPFTSPVTLTATGLPPGATVTFANPTYVPGAGPTNTTMTIVTSPTQAMLRHSSGGLNGVYYGLLLLPLVGIRRVRSKIRALPKSISYGLAALMLLGGLGAMTGCGGGYFGPKPGVFTITVTGTSGTLSHSTTVTLTVR